MANRRYRNRDREFGREQNERDEGRNRGSRSRSDYPDRTSSVSGWDYTDRTGGESYFGGGMNTGEGYDPGYESSFENRDFGGERSPNYDRYTGRRTGRTSRQMDDPYGSRRPSYGSRPARRFNSDDTGGYGYYGEAMFIDERSYAKAERGILAAGEQHVAQIAKAARRARPTGTWCASCSSSWRPRRRPRAGSGRTRARRSRAATGRTTGSTHSRAPRAAPTASGRRAGGPGRRRRRCPSRPRRAHSTRRGHWPRMEPRGIFSPRVFAAAVI